MDLGILQYQWRGTPPSPLESIAVNLQLWDGAEEVVDIAASTEIVLNSSIEQGSVELDACPVLLTDVLRRGAARRILTRAARDHARSTADASSSSSSSVISHLTDDEADEAEDALSPAIRLLPPLSDDVDLWQLRVCIRGWADERSLIDVNIPLSTAASIPVFLLLGGDLSLRLSPSPAEKAAAAATAARAAAAAAVAAASVVSVTSSGSGNKGNASSTSPSTLSPRRPPQSSSSSSTPPPPPPPPGSPPPARPASIDGSPESLKGEEENGDAWTETSSSTVNSPASSVDSSSSSSPSPSSNVKLKKAATSSSTPPPAVAESKGEQRSRRKTPSPTPTKFPAPTGAINRSISRSEQEEAEEEEARRQLPTLKLQLDALKKQIADQEARGNGASDALARAARETKLRTSTDARRVTAEAQVKSLKEELQTLETAKMASDRAAVENADVALAWKERSEGWESAYESVKEEYDTLVASNAAAAAEKERDFSHGLRAITSSSSHHRDSVSSPNTPSSPTALALSSQSPSSSSSIYQLHANSSGVARTPPDSGRASPSSSSLHPHSPSGVGGTSSHSASKDASIAAVAAVQAELRETKERHAARLIALETQIAMLKDEADSARSQAAREAAKSKTVRQAFTAAQACLANYVQVLEKACQETGIALGSTRPWTNTIPLSSSSSSSSSSSNNSNASSPPHSSLGALVITAANAAAAAVLSPNASSMSPPSSPTSSSPSSSALDSSSSPLRHLAIRTPFIFSGYEVRALLNGPPISNSSGTVSIASSVSGNNSGGGQSSGQSSSSVADGFLQNDTNVASTGHIALAQSSQNAFTALLRAIEDLYKAHADVAIERSRAMAELQQTAEARAEARVEAKALETRRQLEAQVEERSKLVRDWEFFAQHWETRGRDAEKLNAEWERSFESANRQTGAAAIEAEGLRRMEIRLRFEVESAHAEAKQLRELLVALGHGSALASVVRRLSVPGLGNNNNDAGGGTALIPPPSMSSVLSSSTSLSSVTAGNGDNGTTHLGPTGLLTGVNAANSSASSNGVERGGGGGGLSDASTRQRIPSLPPPPSLHAAHLGLIQQQQQQMQLQQQQREAAKAPAVSVQAATLKKRSSSLATTYPDTDASTSLLGGTSAGAGGAINSVAGTMSSPAGAAAVAKLSAATIAAAATQAYLTRK